MFTRLETARARRALGRAQATEQIAGRADRLRDQYRWLDPEVTYAVNGGCDCPDAARAPEGRCKHRYAVALMRAATKLLAEATAQRYHAQYTSPAGEQILGIATRDEHSRITLFVPEDGREPLFPAPEALVLLGLVCMDRPADEEPLWKRIASPDYAAARSGK